VCAFHRLKLQSYLTESHQIYTQCRELIADEPFEMRIVIFQSVLECHDNQRRWVDWFCLFDPKVGCPSLEQSEKEGQISNLRSNMYHVEKIWWKSVQ